MTRSPASSRYRVLLVGEVTPRVGPVSHGGSGLSMIRLANCLSDAGVSVDVIVSNPERLSAYSETCQPAIGFRYIGRGGRVSQAFRLLLNCVKCGPHFVIARDTRAITLSLIAKRILGRRFRLICALHNEAGVRTEDDPSRERRKQRLFSRMQRFAEYVVGVSPGITEAASRRTRFKDQQIVTIPNSAHSEDAVEYARTYAVKRPAPSGYHLVSMGRLSPEKDQATLLHAFRLLVFDYGFDVQLTLLGEGPERENLEAQSVTLGIAERVHMPGFVRYPMTYMADADAFAVCAVQEAFGLVLVEALAMGIPVISTDCPYGPRFILDGGRYGHLVPVGAPERLAAAIAESLEHPANAESLKDRARFFSPQSTATQYLRLFSRLDTAT